MTEGAPDAVSPKALLHLLRSSPHLVQLSRLVYRCQACRRELARVVGTTPPTLIYHNGETRPDGTRRRSNEIVGHRLRPVPPMKDHGGSMVVGEVHLYAMCGCRTVGIEIGEILADLESGKREVLVPKHL